MSVPLNQIERYLLSLAVFMSPMRELRPTEINFTYSDLLFALLGGMMVVRRRLQIAPMLDASILWMIANLLLIGGLSASSILYGSAGDSLIVCTQYMFAYVFLPFIVLRDEETALILVKAGVFALLFVVVWGFFVAATGFGGTKYVTGSGRLASFGGNPNDFALMIALSTPLLLYVWLTKALPGMLCLAILVCFFIGLIMASSNSGLGATVIGMTIFLLMLGRVGQMVKGALVALLLVAATATVGYDYLPEVFQKRVLTALESGSLDSAGTYSGRMEMIVEASEMLGDSLLLGVGADQYQMRSYWHEPVHNQYLLVWVEGGTIALAGWLLLLMTLILIGLRSYQLRGGAPDAAMVIAVTVIIIIAGTTSPHLYSRAWVVPLLVAIGVPLARRATAMAETAQPLSERRRLNAQPQEQPTQEPKTTPRRAGGSLPHRPAMHAQIHYGKRR
jgi:O-antigen ligase